MRGLFAEYAARARRNLSLGEALIRYSAACMLKPAATLEAARRAGRLL